MHVLLFMPARYEIVCVCHVLRMALKAVFISGLLNLKETGFLGGSDLLNCTLRNSRKQHGAFAC